MILLFPFPSQETTKSQRGVTNRGNATDQLKLRPSFDTTGWTYSQVSHIPEAVYKTSVDWINNRSLEALGSFVLWSLDNILADFASRQGNAKGSKKSAQKTILKISGWYFF